MEATAAAGTRTGEGLAEVQRWISLLCDEIGGRRPTSREERLAAEALAGELRRRGADARPVPYRGYSTFAAPYGLIIAGAVAPALLPRHLTRTRAALALSAAAALALEGELRFTPLSDVLSRRRGWSLTASVDPRSEPRRTVCVTSHLDTSRSGLLFHPAAARLLGPWITAQSLAVLAAAAAEPLLARTRPGRGLLTAARALAAAGLALLLERELRGADVPGANDNASGAAVTARLTAEVAAEPLEHTCLVLLITGGEESGLCGMRSFLRENDTSDWLFLNLDGVGAPATLRYLTQEGVFRRRPADPTLLRLAADLADRRPDLGLQPQDVPAGLTYDATAVLAGGGRALTLSAQDDTIPYLHTPADVPGNLDPDVLARALETGRELIAVIDRGEADPR